MKNSEHWPFAICDFSEVRRTFLTSGSKGLYHFEEAFQEGSKQSVKLPKIIHALIACREGFWVFR